MAKDSRATRTDARRNRTRLLRAAREVLAESGFEAEITEIAARAKVGSGTVYRNYAAKEDLVLEVVREMVHRAAGELLAVAARVSDARECVRQAMSIGFRQVEDYGKLAIHMVAGTAPEPYASVMSREALGHVFAMVLQRGIDQGHFRANLDVDYAVAVWFALVAPSALSDLVKIRSLEEIATLTSDFLLAGISVTPPGPDAANR
jgi:AcrR family transcriptional regulator